RRRRLIRRIRQPREHFMLKRSNVLACPAPTQQRGLTTSRQWLFATVSLAALSMAAPHAHARSPGGPGTPAPSAAAIAAAQAASQDAVRAARDAQNALSRATRAIQSMQATHQAARDAARAAQSMVPNGRKPGGLVPVTNPNSTTDGLTTWIGAD